MRSCDSDMMPTLLSVDLSEAVVAHLVHEAVEEDRGAFFVHSELSFGSEIVGLLDMAALLCASPYPHHPQELVDVWGEGEREGRREGGKEGGRLSST